MCIENPEVEPVKPVDREFLLKNLPLLATQAQTSIEAFGVEWAAGLAKDALQLLEEYDGVLRSLACSLSAGGWNSEGLIAPDTADAKIRWGIDDLVKTARNLATPVAKAAGTKVPATPEQQTWPFPRPKPAQ